MPSARHTPSFHGTPRGDVGPGVEADDAGPNSRPHVDERVTGDEHVRTPHRIGQATFLRPGHEVIEQHTEAALRCRIEGRDGLGEVVGAVQRLDDDAAVAQFVTPHQLEQLGIVATFHPDPARRRDPSSGRSVATDPDA